MGMTSSRQTGTKQGLLMSLLEASLMFWMFPQTLKALDVGGQIQASENRPPPPVIGCLLQLRRRKCGQEARHLFQSETPSGFRRRKHVGHFKMGGGGGVLLVGADGGLCWCHCLVSPPVVVDQTRSYRCSSTGEAAMFTGRHSLV